MGKESSLPRAGYTLGLKMGAGLSVVYLLLFVLSIRLPLEPINSLSDLGGELFSFWLIFVLALLLYGGVVGIVLATLLGGVTGWITGLVLARRGARSRREAILTGMTICAAIAVLLSLAALPLFWTVFGRTYGGPAFFYTLYFGVPSLIYIIAGVRAGAILYNDVTGASPDPDGPHLAEEAW